MEVNVKTARERFSELLRRIDAGEEITILRHGRQMARLVPPLVEKKKLASMESFRESIEIKGESLSKAVLENREKERG